MSQRDVQRTDDGLLVPVLILTSRDARSDRAHPPPPGRAMVSRKVTNAVVVVCVALTEVFAPSCKPVNQGEPAVPLLQRFFTAIELIAEPAGMEWAARE